MANWVENTFEISCIKDAEADCLMTWLQTNSLCQYIAPQPFWMTGTVKDGTYSIAYDDDLGLVTTVPGGESNVSAWREYNWGPTSDISECCASNSRGKITGYFETRWVQLNETFLRSFADKFPTARLSIKYVEEGCGYYGVSIINRGKITDWNDEISTLIDKYAQTIDEWDEMDEFEKDQAWDKVKDEMIDGALQKVISE